MKFPPVIFCASLLSSTILPAAERVALVIGNDTYQNTVKLDNCVNDARAVAGALKDSGFTVVVAENATAEAMHEKLAVFQQQAAGCKVGLFFYAGHGMEDEGKNYLVPVDAALERKAQVPMQTLGLTQVMEKMREAKIPAKILLLDCCRNMPLGRGWRTTRGGGCMTGLDASQLPESTLVYFATAPGTEALDSGASGKHSPFTEGLLQKLKTPGIHAFEALMQVEDVVHEQTGGRQRPKLFSDGETAAFRDFGFGGIQARFADARVEAADDLAAKAMQEAEVMRRQQEQLRKDKEAADVRAAEASAEAAKAKAGQTDGSHGVSPGSDETLGMQLASYWLHNGSTMGLYVNGSKRVFVYTTVRDSLKDRIAAGSILFVGNVEGKRYVGVGRRFMKGFPPIEYKVEGPILEDGGRVVLTGLAPVRDSQGKVERTIQDRIEFSFARLAN